MDPVEETKEVISNITSLFGSKGVKNAADTFHNKVSQHDPMIGMFLRKAFETFSNPEILEAYGEFMSTLAVEATSVQDNLDSKCCGGGCHS
jgi:hypothetical protein